MDGSLRVGPRAGRHPHGVYELDHVALPCASYTSARQTGARSPGWRGKGQVGRQPSPRSAIRVCCRAVEQIPRLRVVELLSKSACGSVGGDLVVLDTFSSHTLCNLGTTNIRLNFCAVAPIGAVCA